MNIELRLYFNSDLYAVALIQLGNAYYFTFQSGKIISISLCRFSVAIPAYPSVLFQKLYFKRWGIEENYKKMKLWLEIERFSGKSALSVKQDFYAKILSLNLTTLLANQAQELVEKNTQKLKKMYQINFAQSLSKMKHEIIRLLRASKIELKNLIDEIVIYMSKKFEIVRKGQKNNVNYYNYVSCL